MKRTLKRVSVVLLLATLLVFGTLTPSNETIAEEASLINPQIKAMLIQHKFEIENNRIDASNDRRAKEENRAWIYKTQLDCEKDRNLTASDNTPKMTFLGNYELTAYIATGNRCASGVYPMVNHTVACNSIPLGTRIYIEGYGEYTVEDTGGMAGNVIDVFVSDYGTAISFGRRTANVYILED